MATFRKLTLIDSSEFGKSQETLDSISDEENAALASDTISPENEEESERETDCEDGVLESRKRCRLGLEANATCTVDREAVEAKIISMKRVKRKSGPKAIWSTELLNDLVDIVANNDRYKRKLIFTNMPKASNAEVYQNIVEDMKIRCQEQGRTFTFNICQTRNRFKKLMSTCKLALLTMKTASGIKRFQDDKQFGSWFSILVQIMRSKASCQPDQGIEPGFYANGSNQAESVNEDFEHMESSLQSTSSDGSSTSNTGKWYVPIKSKKEKKKTCSHEGVVGEVFEQMKTTMEYAPNAMTQLTEFFKEENERVRQHELELFKLMFQQNPCYSNTDSESHHKISFPQDPSYLQTAMQRQ